MSKSKDFNKELIESYIELLTKKYNNMEQDAFNTKARMAVRAEIEDMKFLLAEDRMEAAWDDLSSVFGVKMDKPTASDRLEDFNPVDLESKFRNQSFQSSKDFDTEVVTATEG